MAKIGVLTLSDRASAGVYADESGIAIQKILKEWIIFFSYLYCFYFSSSFSLIFPSMACL